MQWPWSVCRFYPHDGLDGLRKDKQFTIQSVSRVVFESVSSQTPVCHHYFNRRQILTNSNLCFILHDYEICSASSEFGLCRYNNCFSYDAAAQIGPMPPHS
jgi:hypothetical protein